MQNTGEQHTSRLAVRIVKNVLEHNSRPQPFGQSKITGARYDGSGTATPLLVKPSEQAEPIFVALRLETV